MRNDLIFAKVFAPSLPRVFRKICVLFLSFSQTFCFETCSFQFFHKIHFCFRTYCVVSAFKGAVPRDFRPFDLPTLLAVVITSVYFRQERTDASRSRTGRIRSIGQMQNKTYTGQEGSRKGQDRQAEQDVCKTVSMQDSMHERRD